MNIKGIIEQIEDLETIDQLKITITCLNIVIENTRYNIETEEEKQDFDTLEKISNKIFDITLKNGGFENGKRKIFRN